jgi:hypothetical protein
MSEFSPRLIYTEKEVGDVSDTSESVTFEGEEIILQQFNGLLNKRDLHLQPGEGKEIAESLGRVLERYEDRRVLVLAPPCSGKSTLLQHIENGIDMDEVFDTMPQDLRRYVLHHEYPFMFTNGDRETIKYTERRFIVGDSESEKYLRATTDALASYTQEHIKITPGYPVFGTSLIDADVIIYLKLSDVALDLRLQSRNTKTHRLAQRDRVFAIRGLMEEEIEIARANGVIVEEFCVI